MNSSKTTTSRPSRLPLWLLATFACGRDLETLAGDLTEEYRAGRSLGWLWWQMLLGVASTFRGEVRSHPLVMLRAMALGGAAVMLSWPLVHLIRPLNYNLFVTWRAIIIFIAYVLTGWVVHAFHRPHHRTALIACVSGASAVGISLRTVLPSVYSNAFRVAEALLPFAAITLAGLATGVMLARAATRKAPTPEDYRAGRSLGWLWWQVLLGVASTFRGEVRSHPLVMLRAMALGGAAVMLSWPLVHLIRPLNYNLFVTWRAIIIFIAYVLTGWVVHAFHRPHHRTALIACVSGASAVGISLRTMLPSVYSNAFRVAEALLPFAAITLAGLATGVMLARAATRTAPTS